MTLEYPRESFSEAHPKYDWPDYRSTARRTPKRPLVVIPHTLTELTAPIYGHERVRAEDSDLTTQCPGEPQGERIIIQGRVLDEDGRPIPNSLLEVWQANAAGRYIHRLDDHPAPIDANFFGAGRTITDEDGRYKFITIRPGAYPWRNHHNAWRPSHVHFSLLGPAYLSRLVTQMYFPGDPLFSFDPIFNAVPPCARERLIAKLDLATTVPDWALGYNWDIILRGRNATPMEPML